MRNQVLQTIAIFTKRAWLGEETSRSQLFEAASQLLAADADRRLLGVTLISLLLDEFLLAKASQLGVTFDFHRRAYASFQVRWRRNRWRASPTWSPAATDARPSYLLRPGVAAAARAPARHKR